jgi:hypothetical protein
MRGRKLWDAKVEGAPKPHGRAEDGDWDLAALWVFFFNAAVSTLEELVKMQFLGSPSREFVHGWVE